MTMSGLNVLSVPKVFLYPHGIGGRWVDPIVLNVMDYQNVPMLPMVSVRLLNMGFIPISLKYHYLLKLLLFSTMPAITRFLVRYRETVIAIGITIFCALVMLGAAYHHKWIFFGVMGCVFCWNLGSIDETIKKRQQLEDLAYDAEEHIRLLQDQGYPDHSITEIATLFHDSRTRESFLGMFYWILGAWSVYIDFPHTRMQIPADIWLACLGLLLLYIRSQPDILIQVNPLKSKA